jgi:hypothetical protein
MISLIEAMTLEDYLYLTSILLYIFQSMRLMEDFLDLAKENTEKDLETCGILGAFLVRIILMPSNLLNCFVC